MLGLFDHCCYMFSWCLVVLMFSLSTKLWHGLRDLLHAYLIFMPMWPVYTVIVSSASVFFHVFFSVVKLFCIVQLIWHFFLCAGFYGVWCHSADRCWDWCHSFCLHPETYLVSRERKESVCVCEKGCVSVCVCAHTYVHVRESVPVGGWMDGWMTDWEREHLCMHHQNDHIACTHKPVTLKVRAFFFFHFFFFTRDCLFRPLMRQQLFSLLTFC